MKTQQWSVKALVSYLKLKLDNDSLIQNITVIGELSNFNHHHTNHMYFTLKDDKSRIPCVMFASNASRVNFVPESGMQVIVQASVSVFEASGAVQLYVKKMTPFGVGNLALKFEELKEQLFKEGLFKDEFKKKLPAFPMKIAIISGADSAALSDIKTTLNRRWPIAKTTIFNSLVQGKTAHLDIIDKLQKADQEDFDLIILSRGGGSIEDLWPFNEEMLAREIFKLKTPIVSGVGHEVDFTIVDFVSDLRAPTPTAAAEISTPDINDVIVNINTINNRLKENMQSILNNNMLLIDSYRNNATFSHPEIIISGLVKDLEKERLNLINWKDKKFDKIKRFDHLSNNFKNKIQTVIHSERIKLNNLDNNLNNTITMLNNNKKSHLLRQIELIDSFSPINTLKRGYSMVEKDDMVVNSVNYLEKNDKIKLVMHDGSISALVLEKRANNE